MLPMLCGIISVLQLGIRDTESLCGVSGAREEAAERNPSPLSQLAFSWVTPLILLGSRRQLQHDDMLALPAALEPQHCRRLMWQQWHQACSLHTPICWLHGSSCVCPRFVNACGH